MRRFGHSASMRHAPPLAAQALRLTLVMAGIAIVMTSGVARAEDDEEDDSTFEQKIIKNVMTGIGGTNMDNRGIDYRERSPLVIPPRTDLPPPAAAVQASAPNWPKDVDETERRKVKAVSKQKRTGWLGSRPLSPSELEVGRTASGPKPTEPIQPGANQNPMLSPSQLGYSGGVFGMFKGNQSESAQFTGEPARESLIQPPPGYQTPSSNYLYGTGPKDSLNGKHIDVMSGKEVGN